MEVKTFFLFLFFATQVIHITFSFVYVCVFSYLSIQSIFREEKLCKKKKKRNN